MIAVMTTPTADGIRAHGAQHTRWLRAVRIVHPFPTLLNVAAVAGLSYVAADGSPDAGVVIRMLIVMLLVQCAIGVANDICDRELDAATKPWKPIPAGLVSVRATVAACVALSAVAGAVCLTLGPASLALAMLGLACGIAYDVRLKRTLFSAAPFMLAIPTLPVWVWVTLDEWEEVLWWMWPLGGLIGLSLHLANTLPDIDEDAAHGVHGLAHALGSSGTQRVAYVAFASALVLALAVGFAYDPNEALLLAAVGVGGAMLATSVVVSVLRPGPWATQLGFGLLGIGAAIAATGWLAAVT
jgi:4-hydroxybenzoate polyprenyltransferase